LESIHSRSVDRVQVGFWRTYVHVGVLTYVLGGVAALAYLLATPQGPHRAPLVALGVMSIVASIGVFWWVGIRLVETRWRTPFFAAWTVSTIVFIGAGAVLDGGTKSPTSYVLVLPLLFAGLAYPPRTVSTLTGVAMASALCVGLIPGDRLAWSTVLLTTGMFVAGVLATSTARNRQRLTDALVRAASTDWLTGCMTRRSFYERLDHELARARRYGGRVSVVLADLDNLKRLNDSGGHEAGDEALREIADALRGAARTTDFVGRLGGDEFALFLPGTGADEATVVSGRLLEAVRVGVPIPLTASLGVAEWAGPGEEAEALMHRADRALYSAKRAGRDRYVVSERPVSSPTDRPTAATG
jgi:diguanylate cyclase (GGDEF)-like protein